jgi:hypothetical protein
VQAAYLCARICVLYACACGAARILHCEGHHKRRRRTYSSCVNVLAQCTEFGNNLATPHGRTAGSCIEPRAHAVRSSRKLQVLKGPCS